MLPPSTASNGPNPSGIVHRDIKPENILLRSRDDDYSIVLCDFGISKRVRGVGDNSLRTGCGSPHYVAPEVVRGEEYGSKCDVWSLGVVMFTLLCGFLPFDDDNESVLLSHIAAAEYEFEAPYWDNVSEVAKDMIRGIFVVDPDQRPMAAQLMESPWMQMSEAVSVTVCVCVHRILVCDHFSGLAMWKLSVVAPGAARHIGGAAAP